MAFSECVANFVKLSSCSSLCVVFSLIQKYYNRKKTSQNVVLLRPDAACPWWAVWSMGTMMGLLATGVKLAHWSNLNISI